MNGIQLEMIIMSNSLHKYEISPNTSYVSNFQTTNELKVNKID